MINRRYSSTIKTLSKLFLAKAKTSLTTLEEDEKTKGKERTHLPSHHSRQEQHE
jgi:hypothetical protein